MDYQTDVSMEKVSLEMVYGPGNELEILEDGRFKILILEDTKNVSLWIIFGFTENYPMEAPKWKIVDCTNVTNFVKESVEKIIESTIKNNLGRVMIYDIVEDVREYLRNSKHVQEINGEDTKINDESESTINSSDEEHYENVLEVKELCPEEFRVTKEEFETWRSIFYKQILNCIKDKNSTENPTGREIFEKAKVNEIDLYADVDINEKDDVQWKDEKLFDDIEFE